MTTYRIYTPTAICAAYVSNSLVVQAAPLLFDFVGRDFSLLRDHAESCGWQIEPLLANQPRFFELNDNVYELHWKENTLRRITLLSGVEPRDLSYHELPPVIKALL